LINDMYHALDANCYLAAPEVALTLPDICGKAEYPDKKCGERYRDWYDEYVGEFEKTPLPDNAEDATEMPWLSGEVIYSLRNSLLHQGNPNIETKRIHQPENKIDYFELVTESKNKFDLYSDTASVISYANNSIRSYRVNIRRLCLILGRTAAGYYEKKKDKFDFFNFSLIDWDEKMEQIRKLDF